jgi:hypothetical protein
MVQVRLRLLGSGKILAAQVVPRPDKIGMMQKMAKMDMKMGAHALKYRPKKDERFKIKEEYGMQMDMSKDPAMKGMDMNHSKMGWKRTTSSRSKWICPRILQRKEWKWIILRWKGWDDMQEEVVTADSAKKG